MESETLTTTTAPETASDIKNLQELTRNLRMDTLEMIYTAQSGHPGSSFSCIDILTCLWSKMMRHDVKRVDWAERDRFVLSKGHAAPALYAVLMHEGYIPREAISTLRQVHTKLQGHPASKYVDGVDVSTGSLGQGLSVAVGMALGLKLDKNPAHVYCLIGDGEAQEGQIWEAALSAPKYELTNLTVICDRNRLQIDGATENIKPLGDMGAKFRTFGWNVLEMPGHDFELILKTIGQANALNLTSRKPTMIIADTVKGKGVSFMENQAGWHGKAPNAEQYALALKDLETETYFRRLAEGIVG